MGDKIALRLNNIPKKEKLKVIDAYHGKGTIWKNIQKKYEGKIEILKIDKEQKTDEFILLGDNLKYLSSLDLSRYDVIDLDAYGVPYEQLKIIFNSAFRGACFVTFIQSIMGRLQNEFLFDLGYTEAMIKKCPSLFAKNGHNHFFQFLALNGVKKIKIRQCQRKIYLCFQV